MKHFLKLFIILYFLNHNTLTAQNSSLYASFFNATYSCSNPLILNGTVTIYLDEDIIFNGCVPFVAGPLLEPTDKLIFTSPNNHKVIIKANTTVNVGTFLPQQQSIIFTGNAELKIEKGAYIIFANNRLIAQENAHIFFVESIE